MKFAPELSPRANRTMGPATGWSVLAPGATQGVHLPRLHGREVDLGDARRADEEAVGADDQGMVSLP